MKLLNFLIAVWVFASTWAMADDDAPRGYFSTSELTEALEKAAGKKLVVLVVKGADDNCPNCVAAMENGERAVGSGVVKVFARAEGIRNLPQDDFTETLKKRVNQAFSTGASVTFVVFNPDMTEIIAEAGRSELQNDKKATTAFRKKVQAAKKEFR